MTIVLHFYPNGEFTQGVDTSLQRKERRRVDKSAEEVPQEKRDAYLQWYQENADIHADIKNVSIGSVWMSANNNRYTVAELNAQRTVLTWSDESGCLHSTEVLEPFLVVAFQWRLRPLVYQSVESSEKPKSRKKLLSMTRNMARNIRQGVYLLEKEPGGKDVLSFLTLTLPDLSQEGLAACCENWDYMVSRFLDWLSVRIKKATGSFQYVYCTEIQLKRLQHRNEYAPHIHIVFKGRNGKRCPWVVTPKQVRKAWSACIRSVVSEPFRSDALENLQRIKYSAARYLSKYLSKGSATVPSESEGHPVERLRTQWGGMARSISSRIRSFTERFDCGAGARGMALEIINSIPFFVDNGYIKYFKRGFIPLGFDETTGMEWGLHVGCGALSIPTYEGGLAPILAYTMCSITESEC